MHGEMIHCMCAWGDDSVCVCVHGEMIQYVCAWEDDSVFVRMGR